MLASIVWASSARSKQSASAEEPVLYSDEIDIHLNPKIGRDWMLREGTTPHCHPGQEREVLPGRRARRPHGVLHTTGMARKSAALFCELLKVLAASYGARVQRIHLIVDNYAIHSAQATRCALEALGHRVVLHFLPPTALTPTASSASGRTFTPTSPATTAARP